MKGTKEAEFQLQQKPNARKKSKLVKGSITLSFDNKFVEAHEHVEPEKEAVDANDFDYGVVQLPHT